MHVYAQARVSRGQKSFFFPLFLLVFPLPNHTYAVAGMSFSIFIPNIKDPIFRDPAGGLGKRNAWFSGEINVDTTKVRTARAVDERLFESVAPGQNTRLLNLILDALEQDDYCQFEVQFEVAHNNIHYLVGGRHEYSMSTLEWTSYDPIFFLHHSNVDRIWAIWQALQKKRNKAYNHADCSVELFRQKLQPFDDDTNPVALTRTYSTANQLFRYVKSQFVWFMFFMAIR